ncbi:MAG TPA: DNA polymerase III subunit beta [Acidimicrobiia bacterium]|nr:DNA polymerase III subunit beta [Acidimicrobiia bacterium]
MRIRAERDDLADIFSRANRAIGTRTAIPVLQGLLCEVTGSNLWVTGTDHEMTVRASTEVEVMEEGRAVIPGRLLADAVRRMPAGPVTIGSTDGEVEIVGKGPRFSIRPLNVEDFPQISDTTGEGVEVDGEELAAAINQVVVAASTDTARPILTGVLFESSPEGLRMVATDSYRLAVRDLAGVGLEGTGLVPARGLRELPRTIGAAKVTARLGDREAVFSSERGTLRLRLIEGSFPKYRSLLPDSYPNQVIVKREDVLEALGRVSLVAEDHIPVRLKLTEGGVEVSVSRQDVGGETEHIPGTYTGADEEVSVAFNPRYLADGVSAVEGENVRIQVIDGVRASVVDGGEGDHFSYLLMPVRV